MTGDGDVGVFVVSLREGFGVGPVDVFPAVGPAEESDTEEGEEAQKRHDDGCDAETQSGRIQGLQRRKV